MKNLGVQHVLTTTERPQMNGHVERANLRRSSGVTSNNI